MGYLLFLPHIDKEERGKWADHDFRSLLIIQSVMACFRLGCLRGTHISQDIIVFEETVNT